MKIEILTGPLKGKRMQLSFGVHVVGRGVGPLPFQDPGLSGEHAKLHVFPHRFEIEDLSSTNGTFVNDRHISKTALQPGDVVRLGPESTFRVIDVLEEAASSRISSEREAQHQHDSFTVSYEDSFPKELPPLREVNNDGVRVPLLSPGDARSIHLSEAQKRRRTLLNIALIALAAIAALALIVYIYFVR